MERDEHEGHGGSYVVDKGGRRKLVERTAPPVEQPQPQAPAAPADAEATLPPKGKRKE